MTNESSLIQDSVTLVGLVSLVGYLLPVGLFFNGLDIGIFGALSHYALIANTVWTFFVGASSFVYWKEMSSPLKIVLISSCITFAANVAFFVWVMKNGGAQ